MACNVLSVGKHIPKKKITCSEEALDAAVTSVHEGTVPIGKASKLPNMLKDTLRQ